LKVAVRPRGRESAAFLQNELRSRQQADGPIPFYKTNPIRLTAPIRGQTLDLMAFLQNEL
jgi:hypothetical protein